MPPLVAVTRNARAHPAFLAQLARTATDAPPALPHRFFASRWQRQEIDLKKGGTVPIANLSRYYALEAGDIIFSGTPAGVGAAEPGDRLAASIAGLAQLRVNILPAL